MLGHSDSVFNEDGDGFRNRQLLSTSLMFYLQSFSGLSIILPFLSTRDCVAVMITYIIN